MLLYLFFFRFIPESDSKVIWEYSVYRFAFTSIPAISLSVKSLIIFAGIPIASFPEGTTKPGGTTAPAATIAFSSTTEPSSRIAPIPTKERFFNVQPM